MKGSWKFDDVIANSFDGIARSHIPDYERVIARSVEIASAAFPAREAKILDVGSATGYTLERLRAAGFAHVYGVDSSEAMLRKSRVREGLISAQTFPAAEAPFDTVLANWTLHFVPKEQRRIYFSDIYAGLCNGGILIVSDKMTSDQFVHDRYHDFKRSHGVTERAIREKEAAVAGVLMTLPLAWYLDTLAAVGFENIDVIDASWCFKTILCRKFKEKPAT